MLEVIAANRRRSTLLIVLMGLLLAAVGATIGVFAMPGREGALIGLAAALVVWWLLWLTAATSGDSILLASAGARRIEHKDAPLLSNVVEEMSIAAGLAKMPDVYIIDSPTPNAFAVGRTPDRAAVAVTTGLLKRLNRDELQGVIAHEIAHVVNLDIRFMTLAAVMMGAVVLLTDLFLHDVIRGGVPSRRRSLRDNNVAVLMVLLAPLAARMLYFACSRRREYLADASAARFTRYPAGLASALEKIRRQVAGSGGVGLAGNAALAPLYIVNPRQAFGGSGLFSTHPPIEDRIRILRSMSRADLNEYQEVFARLHGGQDLVSGRALAEAPDLVGLREPRSEEPEDDDATARTRQVLHVLDVLARMLVISCVCGMTIKLPSNWNRPTARCPRCGRIHDATTARPTGEIADKQSEPSAS